MIGRRFALPLVLAALLFSACGSDGATTTLESSPPAADATGTPATPTPAAAASPVPAADTAKKLGTPSGVTTTAKAADFSALPGAKAYFGLLDRSSYQVEVPDSWNGELVLYAHGFAGFGPEVAVQAPPAGLRRYMVANGFAWAASSYSENGYVPGIGADDTLALKNLFVQQFGTPKRTYIVGASMGGNVVALALEHHAAAYDGALSICGALSGIEQIDFLASWVAVAEFTSGIHFPIGEPNANLSTIFLQELPAQLGAAATPGERGKQFANVIMNLTGGPRPFFREGFVEQYPVNFGLAMLDPERKLLVNRASTNRDAQYHIDPGLGLTDADLKAGVRRLESDPAARNAEAHPDAVPTTGKISVPLLTLHNTGDLFVPISMEQSYRRKVEAAGKGDLLVQRAIRAGGHCKFSEPELTTAFVDLVAWVRDGKKPKGENLMGDLANAGIEFTNPPRPGDPGGLK